jgi:hypothetical protein
MSPLLHHILNRTTQTDPTTGFFTDGINTAISTGVKMAASTDGIMAASTDGIMAASTDGIMAASIDDITAISTDGCIIVLSREDVTLALGNSGEVWDKHERRVFPKPTKIVTIM